MSTAIVWFRRDLRLTDHGALTAALASADRVLPVYVHAPEEEAPWAPGGASRWWLHHSLAALDAALRARGGRLLLLRGPSLAALSALADATGATRVHWNRSYEPSAVARDTDVKAALRERGLEVESHPGNLLFEPWTIRNGSGQPFRVFTPFWRVCQKSLDQLPPPAAAPSAVVLPDASPMGLPLAALELLPRIPWDAGFPARWTPGEDGALARLDAFLDDDVGGYADGRDRPDLPATSRLGPHLHFGELSPRQAVAATRASVGRTASGVAAGVESFVREIGWREFAHHVLFAFPHTPTAPLDPRFASFPWREDPVALKAWQRGRTGVPIVDAGMRELWHTGWMHNRVRMIVASLLTKNLGLSWLEGARWFHDTLLDADLASNTLGWQWAAGCGADAAPYYRIFNPVLQAERFDPDRAYLRTWLPELARLPNEWLHRPFAAPEAVLRAASIVLDRDYPRPVVDLATSRDRALGAWQTYRGPSGTPPPKESAPATETARRRRKTP